MEGSAGTALRAKGNPAEDIGAEDTGANLGGVSTSRQRGGPRDTDQRVAQRIRQARLRRGLSQGELASAMGLSLQQVHKYETARNRIGAARLVQVAGVLGVDLDWLFDDPRASESDRAPESDRAEDANSRECLELVRTFHRVPDSDQRAAYLALLRAMADGDA